MAYEKKAPDWGAAGIEPPESKKQTGWQVEDRPPAAWLNWYMTGTSDSIKELQDKAAEKEWVEEQLAELNPELPDASTTQKGIVQLSNATDGVRENVAATEKAVKDAKAAAVDNAVSQAHSYTDQQIGLVTETGIPKLVSYPLLVVADSDGQTEFEIPLDTFDSATDTLLVSINRAVLDSTQYTVTNTVRDESGTMTQRAKLNLLSGVSATSEIAMVVLKNVPLGPDGAINGAVLAEGSVPINRVNGLQELKSAVDKKVDLTGAVMTGPLEVHANPRLSTDLNDEVNAGFVITDANTLNRPNLQINGWSASTVVFIIRRTSNRIAQIAFNLSGATSAGMAVRFLGDSWGNWTDMSPSNFLPINGTTGLSGNLKMSAASQTQAITRHRGDADTFLEFDFPEVLSTGANVRIFRNTVTTGNATFTVTAGDNGTTSGFQIINGVISRISGRPIIITAGAGSPEGVVTGAVGSLYLRIDGSVSSTLYVKQSGTGNTGWSAK